MFRPSLNTTPTNYFQQHKTVRTNMSNTFNTPTLYAHDKSKRIKVWKGSVFDDGDKSVITFEFGLEHGKKQVQTKDITQGKNIGKMNETTPFEQAVKDVESKMNKKIDSGYGEDRNNIRTPILPMLAQKYSDRKHKIKYPCIVQPKIDGVRMTCRLNKYGVIEMFTRKGKQFTPMGKMKKELQNIIKSLHFKRNPSLRPSTWDTLYLDGELTSNELTFQQLAGIVRNSKSTEEQLDKVYYTVFDCFDTKRPNWTFGQRWDLITSNWDLLNTDYTDVMYFEEVDKESQIVTFHHQVSIKDGFEGTIIRNIDSLYQLNHRSADLLKFKDFLDDEYEIVGYTEGTGTDKGCVIWTCKTENDQSFSVRPRGTVLERQGYFQNGDEWIGSKLTVRYQELTDDGIPRFPVGITIRNYE